jgi:hypothetical protein
MLRNTGANRRFRPSRAKLTAILTLLSLSPALAQTADYERPTPRPAAEVVPEKLLRGPHYEIASPVPTFAFMNRYSVKSDFGAFTVTGDARLRRLLREIPAIAELQKIKTSDAFTKAAGEAAMGPVRAAESLIDDPVETVSRIPEGIVSVFSRVSEQVRRGGRSQYEDSATASLLAVSGYKRDLARQFGFDVYSSNEVLQKELNSVAWASASGNLSIGAVTMVSGAVVLEVAGNIRLLDQAKTIITTQPPQELSRRNRATLAAMGVPPATADKFLENRVLSPRHQTVICEAMRSLGDIPGQAAFIRYAAQAENEDSALLFQQMAELFAGYHATVSKLRRLEIFVNLPIGYASNGSAILMVPVDRVVWTQRTAEITGKIARDIPKPVPVKQVEIWMTGEASPRARERISAQQITLVERAGQRLPLMD